MEAENILLGRLLRIITPEEITELTTTSTGSRKVSLTELIETDLRDEEVTEDEVELKAKILPFKRKDESDVPKVELKAPIEQQIAPVPTPEPPAVTELEAKEVSDGPSSEKRIFEEEAPPPEEEKIDTTSFLLAEKKRFERNQKVLKGREVLELYQQNAAVSIEQEKRFKDDVSKDAVRGVLVNRRQS